MGEYKKWYLCIKIKDENMYFKKECPRCKRRLSFLHYDYEKSYSKGWCNKCMKLRLEAENEIDAENYEEKWKKEHKKHRAIINKLKKDIKNGVFK